MTGFFQRTRGTHFVAACFAAGFCWLLGSPASAAAEEAPARPKWVPAFAFFGGISIAENSGSVSGTPDGVDLDQILLPPECLNSFQLECMSSLVDRYPISQRYFTETSAPPGDWLPNTVGPFSGSSRSVFPHVGASLELAAPVLSAGPLETLAAVPFIHGDVALTFDVDHTVATTGDPTQPRVPVLATNTPPSLETVGGQGSRVSGEVEPWVFSAGAGLAFEFPLLGRAIRIKPSVEYRYDKVTVNAFVSAAAGGASFFGVNPVTGEATSALCPCLTSQTQGSKTESFHSLGPGLEIEMDAARAGPVMLTLFLSGGYYHVLGNREIEVDGAGPWNYHSLFGGTVSRYTQDGSPNDFGYLEDPVLSTSATYERDKFIYRANVGLRFRWLPE